MASDARPGWGARIAAMLFSGLFMLAFGGTGLFVGVLPLLDLARQSWLVSSWQPVSARVMDTSLVTSRGSKGSVTYAVKARYAYTWQGGEYESTRIGLDTWVGADNIGDWHERWHDRLQDAQSRNQPVAAWVNPSDPRQALLERRPRWGMVAFRLPFGLIFTAVGVGAGFIFVRAASGRLVPQKRHASQKASRAVARDGGSPSREEWNRTHRIVLPRVGAAPPPLPAGVRGSLHNGEGLRFVRWWPRVLALCLLAVALVVVAVLLTEGERGWLASALWAAGIAGLVALALHLISDRWTWRRDGDAVRVDHRSWMRGRTVRVTRAELGALEHQLVFTSSTNGGPQVHHRRLQLRGGPGGAVPLTPALAGADAVQAMAEHLHHALKPR
jgi:hypothetical protein